MPESAPIDSPHNRSVAAARSLLSRKGRAAASAFLVEGPHSVGEALASAPGAVQEVFLTEAAAGREPGLLRAAATAGATVRTVTERVLASFRDTVTSQGVIAVVAVPAVDLGAALGERPQLVVVLDTIADPGNAGAVIRTADAAGAAAVVATTGSVDMWSGKCVRSTAGSVFHVPVVSDVSIDNAVETLRSRRCQIFATAADGDSDLDQIIDAGALAPPTAWIFGNEAHGLATATRALADRVVRLPVYGKAESLNLAAAAAICLYASARAHRH
jgi:TrmH family RNA methyltransferase